MSKRLLGASPNGLRKIANEVEKAQTEAAKVSVSWLRAAADSIEGLIARVSGLEQRFRDMELELNKLQRKDRWT